jgi:Kef-type K+ transport system membrane component KefB
MFFASIGIEISLPNMTTATVLFSAALLAVAIVTKVVGCGIGAKICGYSKRESIQIGVGTISRGEVALIVASKGSALGLMSNLYFGPTIMIVMITTIITPILLNCVFSPKKAENYDTKIHRDLADRYEEAELIDLNSQSGQPLNV